jgi:hypothetical protein
MVLETSSQKETSPWLQLTQWPTYLYGHRLASVAALIAPPNKDSEPVLVALSSSLERIIDEAYASVYSDQINAFDQVRINSFL